MKKYFLPAIRLTIVCVILFSIVYPFIIWVIAKTSFNNGRGEVIIQNGKEYYTGIGQPFTTDKYFWPRPSATGYDATNSGGSNNILYSNTEDSLIQSRLSMFLAHNIGLTPAEVPSSMLMASASGIDPDITEYAALIQVTRVAKARALSVDVVQGVVYRYAHTSMFGGSAIVNVLKMNLALDRIATK